MLKLSDLPALYLLDGAIPDALRLDLLAMSDQLAALEAAGISAQHDPITGTSFEPARGQHPATDALLSSLGALLDITPSPDDSIRWRRYHTSQAHPSHLDNYNIGDRKLYATALVCLEAPDSGGQTFFPCAYPAPISAAMRPGRLLLWLNLDEHGDPEPTSRHAGLAVSGVKTTATWFIYLDAAGRAALDAHLAHLAHLTTAAPAATKTPDGVKIGGHTLHYIGSRGAPETGRALREACAARGVGFVELNPADADMMALRPLPPGALLYRAGTSALAQRLEAMLIGPGTGHLYADDDGPLRSAWHDLTLLRAGLPLPRRAPLADADPQRLAQYVQRLGGYPVVLRFPGGSGGVGVVRVDSQPALASLADWACAQGHQPELMAYIPDAIHWRAIVVGDHVAAAYINPSRADDFRSEAGDDAALYDATPPAGLEALAIKATHALGLRFGGVDLLVHPSGRLYLLEVNSPCYFGHAQDAGRDVAGAMVNAMLARATPR